ncbi:MAG: succinate dehydrogenase iron-sulfur subunit [Candidatus Nitrosopolaris sp.]|jgi:succinate dehydrogenase / fumarate reductase iron-sulfur subunit
MGGIIEKISMLRTDSKRDRRSKKSLTTRSSVVLRVYRANKANGDCARYDTFEVPIQRWTTVLDALLYAKAYEDTSIAIRYSCRMASCGSCGMKINGRPRLACYTNVAELESDVISCEPLTNFALIRDLVTDFSEFFRHHKSIRPYIINQNADLRASNELSEFIQSPVDVDEYLQFSYCIKCGLCYSACPTVATDTKFLGPQALAQAYRYSADTRDNGSREDMANIDDKHGIWRCHFAGSCSNVCPKGVDPALGIQLLRRHLTSFSKHDKKIAEIKHHNHTIK